MTTQQGTFIIGSPRSGTTLLQSLLSSHSQFYSPPETSFFLNIIPQLGITYADPNCIIDEHAIQVIKKDFEKMTGIALEIGSAITPGMTIRHAFEGLLSLFNTDNKPRWIEKTTNHARCMLAIQRYYTDAKFIHIIRDPVDCASSMMKIRPVSVSDLRISYISSYFATARMWKRCVSAALLYPKQQNTLHIYYENLIQNPEAVMIEACRFLEVPYEEAMMSNFHTTANQLFSKQSCPWQVDTLRPGFHLDSVHKSRKNLPAYHVWLIQRYVQDLSRFLGYYESISIPSRIMLIAYIGGDLFKLGISITKIEFLVRKFIGAVSR